MWARNTTWPGLTCGVLAVLAGAAHGASGSVLLKVKLQVGKQYVHRMTIGREVQTSVPDQSEFATNRSSLTAGFVMNVVKARPDGGVVVEMAFTPQEMQVNAMGQDMRFPGHDAARSPLAPSVRAMADSTITMTLDADSTIQDIQGLDELMRKVAAKSSPGARMMVFGMLNTYFLKQMHQITMLPPLPATPVSMGHAWRVNTSMKQDSVTDRAIRLTYKFQLWKPSLYAAGHHCALLTIAGKIPIEKPDDARFARAVSDGIVSGTTWFDVELGWPTKATAAMHMSTVIRTPEQKPKAIQHITQKQTIDLVKVGPIPAKGANPRARSAPKKRPRPKRSRPSRMTAERRAQSRLQLALNFLRGDLRDKARKVLAEIVKDYPDTEAAKTARAKLKELGR